MTSCEKLYEYWQKRGNFCGKSDDTAKKIDEFIAYRRRNRLEASGINRTAMYPLQSIEDSAVIHLRCVKEIKKLLKKVKGVNITRRMVIEIINRVNNDLSPENRITHIPNVRVRMEGNQHAIEGLSWETREQFDKLKSVLGEKSNDVSLSIIFEYLKGKTEKLQELEKAMSLQFNKKKTEEFEVVSTP